MGTDRKMLGYVVVVKPFRKSNGAVGGGRKGSTGKRCLLYKMEEGGGRSLVSSVEGATAKDATRELRRQNRLIPQYVSIKDHGETFF
jgi:hypothetical protein